MQRLAVAVALMTSVHIMNLAPRGVGTQMEATVGMRKVIMLRATNLLLVERAMSIQVIATIRTIVRPEVILAPNES